MRTEERVLSMATPICQDIGCEIVDVEWKKEGADWFLRVFIDREPAVDHELCAEVSRALGDALDEEDFIENNYVLEVSSPGLERPLKKATDFQRFAGETAVIKLFAAEDGKKEFIGELLGYTEGGVGIRDRETEKEYTFTLDKISKAHLLFEL
ncbi:MAG: ribosome maturation factor RimP [Bacillota bacterium]|jgi:ribosome maturation factor RimP